MLGLPETGTRKKDEAPAPQGRGRSRLDRYYPTSALKVAPFGEVIRLSFADLSFCSRKAAECGWYDAGTANPAKIRAGALDTDSESIQGPLGLRSSSEPVDKHRTS